MKFQPEALAGYRNFQARDQLEMARFLPGNRTIPSWNNAQFLTGNHFSCWKSHYFQLEPCSFQAGNCFILAGFYTPFQPEMACFLAGFPTTFQSGIAFFLAGFCTTSQLWYCFLSWYNIYYQAQWHALPSGIFMYTILTG